MKLRPGLVAVVVGGAGGIGRGTALGLAGKGVRCVIADIEVDNAEVVARELRDDGHEAVAVEVDATDRDSLAALLDVAESAFGPVQILSNNVGIVVDQTLVESSEEQWGWAFEFNVMTIVRACSIIVPRIRSHGQGGHVVNTASMAGLWASTPEEVSGVHFGLYTATKHAVLGYSETLRGELAGEGIGVSCLCPGMVDSNLLATSMRNRPERYGGPVEVGDTRGMIPNAMAQEDVGDFVVAGIEEDRPLILTHPAGRRLVEARYASMLDDFDFASAIAER